MIHSTKDFLPIAGYFISRKHITHYFGGYCPEGRGPAILFYMSSGEIIVIPQESVEARDEALKGINSLILSKEVWNEAIENNTY